MRAFVDENVCTGCGPCEEICPKVFHVVDGIARVLVNPVPKDAEEDCREAKDSCPVEAISVSE